MSDVKTLQQLALTRQEVAAEVSEIEEQLKDAKKRLLRLDSEDIPTMMAEVGLNSFELEDGTKLSLKADVKASITAANLSRAVDWLRERGYGDIVDTEVAVKFSAGDVEEASAFYEGVVPEHPDASLKAKVHPMRLKSFVKERLEAGDDIPFDLFGVHEYTTVQVKLPK